MPLDRDRNQDEVIAFLSDPASYPERPAKVERVDTHGAIVFLAGSRVYKMKRAVRLPYFDFSTLEKRRAACEREMEINRLTAPQLYLGVVPVVRQDSSLSLGGPGEAVEWTVEMARFDQDLLLDRMAEREAIPPGLMTPLADHIAEYHARAPIHREGGVEALEAVVDQVASAVTRSTATLGHEAQSFAERLRTRFAQGREQLQTREKEGHVRRCHGDLHLRNIVLLDGRPTLFDALEFDEALATIDVLYDLAFVLMDLWRRGCRRHANTLFNRYLWRAGAKADIAALSLMPLLLSLRAGVRTLVALDRMGQLPADARGAAQKKALSYFTLAQDFLSPPPPRLIAVGGLSGTGKSTLAAALAGLTGAVPGALHLRSDVERKLLLGRRPEEKLDAAAYTPEVTTEVYATLAEKARLALGAGHSVILDAVYAQTGERNAAEDVARTTQVPFDGLWLTAPERELVRRVEHRRGDASDANADVVRQQIGYETGEVTWRKLDASGSPAAVAGEARRMLKLGDDVP